jgi:hypothetical protein
MVGGKGGENSRQVTRTTKAIEIDRGLKLGCIHDLSTSLRSGLAGTMMLTMYVPAAPFRRTPQAMFMTDSSANNNSLYWPPLNLSTK